MQENGFINISRKTKCDKMKITLTLPLVTEEKTYPIGTEGVLHGTLNIDYSLLPCFIFSTKTEDVFITKEMEFNYEILN